MAAYAALVSIVNIIEQIQNHRRHSFSFDNKQMESLSENVNFLVEFLECCPDGGYKEVEALERQIASAAYAAEDVLESHVVDQIHDGSTLNGETTSCFLVNLQNVIEDMGSIKKLAMDVKTQRGYRDRLTTYSGHATSSRPLATGKNVMVDYDDELIQLIERLTREQPNRQIIPIVGMGGIGKTTLAKSVYEHLHIVQHFDVRLWAIVSQDYNAKQILLQLLSCLMKLASHQTIHELGELLHKALSGRRYLVVLDDMWSVEAWEEIQLFLPHNSNGSSIVITTRQSTMSLHLGSNSFEMKFLDGNTSWKLLCDKAFGEESCPLELEDIGKKIAKNCKGLPLSIVVIGGHLRKSSRMKEYWELVANDMKSILNFEDDELCFKILSLSYSYLPVYLKPCFLYMGIYPEDKKILVSKMMVLWVAEGFIKPNKVESLEEIAEGYFRDLVDRNLILVSEHIRAGEIYDCNIHDLVRELCLRVAEKEKFFCALNNDTPQDLHIERRVVVYGDSPREENHPEIFHALRSAPFARSLNWKSGELSFRLKLLRVLNGVDDTDGAFGYFQQENLRYIYCNYNFVSCPPYIPSSISRLWNLQTLQISGVYDVIVPSEIWEMPQLRNVELLEYFCLPDPPLCSDPQDEFVLKNLQKLLVVRNFRMSEEVCKRIPNIKKLNLWYDFFGSEDEASSYYFSPDVGRFHKLVSLTLYFGRDAFARDVAKSFTFPSSLKELHLEGCYLHWEDLTKIGSLPYLEVLLLHSSAMMGPEWNPIEGQFRCLKYLLIRFTNIIRWNADNSHFPVLEKLSLAKLYKLEFPSGIGEIPTLELITLYQCGDSTVISAAEMLVEQESLGNENLKLIVQYLEEEDVEDTREMLEREGLASDNLFIETLPSQVITLVTR